MVDLNTGAGTQVVPVDASRVLKAEPKPWWHYQPIVLSATQVDTFDLCQRKWAWKHIEGLAGTNVFAQKGIAIDDMVSAWLEKGTPIDATSEIGKIIVPGMKHLPLPGTPTLKVQREFKLRTDTVIYYGKKDFEWFDEEIGLPIVGDSKSTVSFQWAKTEDDLKKNTQAVIYAAEAVSHFKTDSCELRWVYFRTRGSPASKVTRLRIFRSELEEQMDRVDGIAKQIVDAYKAMPDATDLPINPGACEAFGGCPYRENCNLTSLQRMKALMAQESKGQSLIEKMRADAAAKAAAKAAAGGGVAPATNNVTPISAAKPAATAAAAAPATGGSTLAQRIAAQKAERAAQGVNPPAVGETPVSAPPPMPAAAEAAAAGTPAPAAASAAPAADTTAEAAKRGRGPAKPKTNGSADSASPDVVAHMAAIAAAAIELRKLGCGVNVTYEF